MFARTMFLGLMIVIATLPLGILAGMVGGTIVRAFRVFGR